MFCLDYAVAFVAHYWLASRRSEWLQSHPAFTFSSGAVAGGVAAVVLYPFDIVRMTTVPAGTSHFAFSTMPFMSVYLGLYFLQPREERLRKSLGAKAGWALASTATAAVAELPFDKAKVSISGGSVRSAALATALRVPLGAALLLAYDQILSSAGVGRGFVSGEAKQ
tara:strand:- start:682 stop:1182 length:501 start_codon:yes stop_codon:yes gene_type:complete